MDVKVSDGNPALAPDIDSVETDSWPKLNFPIRGRGQRNVVQLVVKRSVLNAIREHGLSRTDVEVCGVLVGNFYQDERGPFIYIEGMIKGEHSENQVAQVTFTAETWSFIQKEMDQHFDSKRILGWYHTHPGFGIFLSAMDMFIHENFFNSSEQLALVYDPLSGEDGLFVWHEGKAETHRYMVQEDSRPSVPLALTGKHRLTAASSHADGDISQRRIVRIENQVRVLSFAVALSFLMSIIFPFAIIWLELPSRLNGKSGRENPIVIPNKHENSPQRPPRNLNGSSFEKGSPLNNGTHRLPQIPDIEETNSNPAPVLPPQINSDKGQQPSAPPDSPNVTTGAVQETNVEVKPDEAQARGK